MPNYFMLSAVSVLIWIFLIFFRGGFWRADQRLGAETKAPEIWPAIIAVIPARNEAETIADSVLSLIDQDYPGDLSVIVVNDNSEDETAALARSVETDNSRRAVHVIDGEPLKPGWTGKMWAVSQGVKEAERIMPDGPFLLLTDADIRHGRSTLRNLVSKALAGDHDLVSLMVLLRTTGFWERMLAPAFVYFFQKLYPFPWVNDPARRTAGAAGGCMLVRRSALERIGGIETICDQVIDDCSLAAKIKPGGSIWLGLAEESHSIRGYDGLRGFWDMVARTAFVQLNHSWLLLSGTVAAMLLIYLLPPVAFVLGVLSGEPGTITGALIAWLLMTMSYLPTLRLYQRPVSDAFLLPFLAVLFTAMTIDSAFRSFRGAAAGWKGRTYAKTMNKSE